MLSSASTATVSNVAFVSAGVYDITVSGGTLSGLNGTVGLPLKPSAPLSPYTTLVRSAVTSFAATGTSESYAEDNTAPTLTSVLRQTPSSSLTNAANLV